MWLVSFYYHLCIGRGRGGGTIFVLKLVSLHSTVVLIVLGGMCCFDSALQLGVVCNGVVWGALASTSYSLELLKSAPRGGRVGNIYSLFSRVVGNLNIYIYIHALHVYYAEKTITPSLLAAMISYLAIFQDID